MTHDVAITRTAITDVGFPRLRLKLAGEAIALSVISNDSSPIRDVGADISGD
jgi:hypothetical protein